MYTGITVLKKRCSRFTVKTPVAFPPRWWTLRFMVQYSEESKVTYSNVHGLAEVILLILKPRISEFTKYRKTFDCGCTSPLLLIPLPILCRQQEPGCSHSLSQTPSSTPTLLPNIPSVSVLMQPLRIQVYLIHHIFIVFKCFYEVFGYALSKQAWNIGALIESCPLNEEGSRIFRPNTCLPHTSLVLSSKSNCFCQYYRRITLLLSSYYFIPSYAIISWCYKLVPLWRHYSTVPGHSIYFSMMDKGSNGKLSMFIWCFTVF